MVVPSCEVLAGNRTMFWRQGVCVLLFGYCGDGLAERWRGRGAWSHSGAREGLLRVL
ncbi:hypothetical protein GCM10010411_95460 [Actinomadura fulvescens]|uniref:Uncharacterized protein n=1 Tax=Actinomadura fulvescens TaxID=46160 RepID=A0ABP6DD93_9ACTN